MKTVSRINTAWLIIVTYRTEWEPCFDREIIDFATWYVMNTGVLCASLGSRVIAGARLPSLVPSCSLLWKINDSFVQFSEIRVRQAYSHLWYLKLYRNRNCEVSCNRFSHLFIVGPTLKQQLRFKGWRISRREVLCFTSSYARISDVTDKMKDSSGKQDSKHDLNREDLNPQNSCRNRKHQTMKDA